MENILHTPVSVLHTLAALLAVILGTGVVAGRKGTPQHRRAGYAYVGCMLTVCGTAFGMYHLFGSFGIVHWGALGSLLTLLGGVGAAALKRPAHRWRAWHETLMGWSVTGLYAAGLVETTYRIFPPRYFWWICLGVSSLTFVVGGLLLHRRRLHGRIRTARRTNPQENVAVGAVEK